MMIDSSRADIAMPTRFVIRSTRPPVTTNTEVLCMRCRSVRLSTFQDMNFFVVVVCVTRPGANELHLEYFKFVGRIFGKALLEQHTISGHFTVPIYKHMLAYVTRYRFCELGLVPFRERACVRA